MTPRSMSVRLSISVASTVLFFGSLELGLRIAGFEYPPEKVPVVIWNRVQDKSFRKPDNLFERAPRQLWTLRPGAPDPWEPGAEINEEGYRGPLIPRERKPGTVRIATLGDSSTFGVKLPFRQSYTAQLGEQLSALGIQVEVLNGGVVGYTVRQGIERYRRLARGYRPDFVVVAFGAVNEHLPAIDLTDEEKIQRRRQRSATLNRGARFVRNEVRLAHLLAHVADHWGGFRRQRRHRRLQREADEQRIREDCGRSDWPGRRRVSVEEFEQGLELLREMIEADGAEMILVSMPRAPRKEERAPVLLLYNQATRDFAARHRIQLFPARARVQERLQMGDRWEDLFLDAYHPSPRGHALFAGGLAEILRRRIAEI